MLQVTAKDTKSNMGDHIDIRLTSSDDNVDEVNVVDNPLAPVCEGISRRIWLDKCVIFHRVDKVSIAKGICRNINSDVVVGCTNLLRDSHVVVQISSNLSLVGVLYNLAY